MLAMCRAIVARRASVRDVTPGEVDELSTSRSAANEYWREDLLLRFSARQRMGGAIEVVRDCGTDPCDVVDLCESLLDGRDLNEIDDTHYHRHIAMAG